MSVNDGDLGLLLRNLYYSYIKKNSEKLKIWSNFLDPREPDICVHFTTYCETKVILCENKSKNK